MAEKTVYAYTDGSASRRIGPNGHEDGPGGFAAVIVYPFGETKRIGGNKAITTVNEMELRAILAAAEYVNPEEYNAIAIYSDSQWSVNAINGRYKKLKYHLNMLDRIRGRLSQFNQYTVNWIPRNSHPLNVEADRISRERIDWSLKP